MQVEFVWDDKKMHQIKRNMVFHLRRLKLVLKMTMQEFSLTPNILRKKKDQFLSVCQIN